MMDYSTFVLLTTPRGSYLVPKEHWWDTRESRTAEIDLFVDGLGAPDGDDTDNSPQVRWRTEHNGFCVGLTKPRPDDLRTLARLIVSQGEVHTAAFGKPTRGATRKAIHSLRKILVKPSGAVKSFTRASPIARGIGPKSYFWDPGDIDWLAVFPGCLLADMDIPKADLPAVQLQCSDRYVELTIGPATANHASGEVIVPFDVYVKVEMWSVAKVDPTPITVDEVGLSLEGKEPVRRVLHAIGPGLRHDIEPFSMDADLQVRPGEVKSWTVRFVYAMEHLESVRSDKASLAAFFFRLSPGRRCRVVIPVFHVMPIDLMAASNRPS